MAGGVMKIHPIFKVADEYAEEFLKKDPVNAAKKREKARRGAALLNIQRKNSL